MFLSSNWLFFHCGCYCFCYNSCKSCCFRIKYFAINESCFLLCGLHSITLHYIDMNMKTYKHVSIYTGIYVCMRVNAKTSLKAYFVTPCWRLIFINSDQLFSLTKLIFVISFHTYYR